MPEPTLNLPKAPLNWDLMHLGAETNVPSAYCTFHPHIDHPNVGSPLMNDTTYDAIFQEARNKYPCYPDWRSLKALAISESSLNPNANVYWGAGLMQINPQVHDAPTGAYIPPNDIQAMSVVIKGITYTDSAKTLYNRRYWITHPKESIFEAAKLLCRYISQFGGFNNGILAYKGFGDQLNSTRAQEILATYHIDYNQLVSEQA